MKRLKVGIVALIMVALCASCGGGGGGSSDSELYEDAITALQGGDIEAAKAAFTQIINQSAGNVSTELSLAKEIPIFDDISQAYFGRALCNIILLMESTPVTQLLAGFSQAAWPVETFFGDTGWLSRAAARNAAGSGTIDRSDLPFADVSRPGIWRQVMGNVTAGYTSADAIASFGLFDTLIDEIIDDLESAIATAGATFVIPKELLYADADITVQHADMVSILAGMYMEKFFFNLLNSWTATMTLSGLFDATGNFIGDKQTIVDELNTFFTLRSDNQLSAAQSNLASALTHALAALDEIMLGGTGGLVEYNSTNDDFWIEARELVADVQAAQSGPTPLAAFSPIITADLTDLFTTPPDGSQIASDAFVLELSGKIKPVEAFFTAFMQNIVDYDLTTHPSVTVFSATVRGIQGLVKKLFPTLTTNSIAGFRLQ